MCDHNLKCLLKTDFKIILSMNGCERSHTHIHIHIHAHAHVHAHTHMYTNAHTHAHTHRLTRTRTRTHTQTYTHTHTHTHRLTRTRTRTRTCTHTHTHTHTHDSRFIVHIVNGKSPWIPRLVHHELKLVPVLELQKALHRSGLVLLREGGKGQWVT